MQTVSLLAFKPRQALATVRFEFVDSDFPGIRLFLCNALLVPGVAFALWIIAEYMRLVLGMPSEDEISPAVGLVLVTLIAVLGLFVWFVVCLIVFLLGRQLIQSACRPSPELLRGSHSLALHASCVLAPSSAALIIDLLIGGPAHSAPLLLIAGGLIWFAALCLLASRWPNRTPPARNR
jgi:hypothetical protein